MVMLPEARTPPGLRIYAIGDVHGCADLLAEMHVRIAGDLTRRPVADWRVVHVGDYIDRGPESSRVLDMLADYSDNPHAEFLCGNHDAFLIEFLRGGGLQGFEVWMRNGGVQTLENYGLDGSRHASWLNERPLDRLRGELDAAMGAKVKAFLDDLDLMIRYGDFVFVHAGLRPGVSLELQEPMDLMWIRDEFLLDPTDHGAVVVHGHTPVNEVDVQPNRIGIDTGAVFSGTLTCLVLQDADRALLGPEGPEPLAVS